MTTTLTESGSLLPTTEQTVGILEGLLQGALAADEAYKTVSCRFVESPDIATKLRAVRGEHEESVRILREFVARYGGVPAEGTNVGEVGKSFARVAAVASNLGPITALAALQEAEQEAIADYRRALDRGIPAECQNMILGDLLPRCEAHIAVLDDCQTRLT